MRYAVLGPSGTFSELAYLKYADLSKDQAVYCPSIEGVFDILEEVDAAIVPFENTLDGYISQTIDQLSEKDARIEAEIVVAVQYAFLYHGAAIGDVKRVFVQFAAMGQCQAFLRSLPDDVLRIMTSSNMESFGRVHDGLEGDGAVVPMHQADRFLGNVISNITDSADNATRFVVVKKHVLPSFSSVTRVAILVTPREDRPGLLYDLLGIFKAKGINLSAILSRPTKTEMGQYRFYLEMISSNTQSEHILQVIHEVEQGFSICVLGIYPAAIHFD